MVYISSCHFKDVLLRKILFFEQEHSDLKAEYDFAAQ